MVNEAGDSSMRELLKTPYVVRDSRELEGMSLVLLDPDDYLRDPEYKRFRREGGPALHNLWAFDASGRKLWEAEFPEANDYYYEIVGTSPLVVRSYSGFTCELDRLDGKIMAKSFQK